MPRTQCVQYPIHTPGLDFAELKTGERALVSDESSHMCMLLAQSKLAMTDYASCLHLRA
jgi:hypothetical protein